jgi:uncharacterized protein
MEPEVAAHILTECARYNSAPWRTDRGTVAVYWHGGEPMLASVAFFREMLRVEAGFPRVSFVNHLQSNASLMTDEFAQFLVENGFRVGFSLDGPPEINDRQRSVAGARESAFEAAWRGIETFRRYSPTSRIPIIAVITRASAKRAKEIYAFFKEVGAEVQLDLYDLRCSDIQPGGEVALNHFTPTRRDAREFLIELFDLWFHDREHRIDIKELRDELDRVLKPERCFPNPLHKKRCHYGRVIFDPNGRVFQCDQHINDAGTALGDIRRDTLATIMRRKACAWDRIKRVVRHSSAEFACAQCEWATSCIGGCLTCLKHNSMLLDVRRKGLPDHSWPRGSVAPALHEYTGESYYCEALRALRAHIREEVRRELPPGWENQSIYGHSRSHTPV